MKSLEPIFNSTQATTFDEERARTEISKRVGALYGDCVAKLGASTAPNTILKAIPIASDEFHSEKIGEICQEQANLMNERAKSEGVPIRFEVMREKNTLYIVDGRYRLKEEAVEPAKAEFDVGVHYFDISHSTLDGHVAALGGANLTEKDYNGLKETLVEAFAMKERGEITDASHVGIVKNQDGSFELSHEGLIETGGRASASAQNYDEPPNFTLNQEYADILTPQVLSYASEISHHNYTSMKELMQNEELLFQSVLGVMTQRRQALAYVVDISNNPGFDFRNISDRTELTLDNNRKFKARVFKVISQSENDIDMLVKMPNGMIERCEIKNSDNGYLLYRKNWKRDDSSEGTIRNPNITFEQMRGDCDEYALLAAAYFKSISFKGKISLGEVQLSGNKPGHAFILGFEDKRGKQIYYQMDFTLKDKFAEFKTVNDSEGKIDWRASLSLNYSQIELASEAYPVKRVIVHEGFDSIESYLYNVKASNQFDFLRKTIPSAKRNLSEAEKTEIGELNAMITRGLELDPSNSDLHAARGDMNLNWGVGLSNFENKAFQKLKTEALNDYCTAMDLDQNNDHALYRYAAEIRGEDAEISKEYLLRSLKVDALHLERLVLLEELTKK